MAVKICAAVSGYANVGMPAWSRISSPVSTAAPPIQLASTGLPGILAYCCRAWAVAVGSLMAWGVRITSSPSMLGSWDATSSVRA